MVRRHCGGSGPRTNNAAYYVCFPRWAADGDGEGGQGRPELSCSFSPEKEGKKKYGLKRKYVRGGSVGVALSTHG